ncbi:ATP-binding protein [Cryptosporangium aurantiacum]|uniref:histidine kinase n=1 Tax=Cryptosporangium aurantiacum TaxID=134849 RepID=A0A1M7RFM9_9ACTN|nr:ATP-binding protein [Cryptosporangium aurantiacum]SHN45087.1 PAS domain S-box-containing protein [Cryptosporangium aurantiacum]
MAEEVWSGTAAGRLNDPARLQALRATGLSETTSAPILDRLTGLAARWLRAPIALVSLVEADRQFFASAHGLTGERQTPLERSFCRHVVLEDAALVVGDARLDDRLRDDPAVAGGVVAYAGIPLSSPEGHVLGTFCVMDTRPRTWTDLDLATLADLAAAAEAEIALRQANGRLAESANRRQRVLDTALDAYVAISPSGSIAAWNAAAEGMFGWSAAQAVGQGLTGLIVPERFREAHERGLERVRATGRSTLAGQRLELAAVDRDGREFPIELTLQVSGDRDTTMFHAFIRDITDRLSARAALEHERQRLADERTFLQTLLDSLDTGVVACDSAGRLALFNQALLRMHGTNIQPLDAETWALTYDLHGPDGRTPLEPDENPLTRAFSGQVVDGQEMVITAPGVSARRFLANGRPIDTPDGRRLGAVVALHDITDAHRAEALRRAEQAVAQALADATSADQAAGAALAAVAGGLGWSCGEYWELDEESPRPVRISRWVNPGGSPCGHARRFGTDGPDPGDAVDPLAREVWENRSTIVTDPQEEDVRIRIGLPVPTADTVSGVVLFCLNGTDPPDADTLIMLDGVCARIGRYLARRRTEDLALALAAARRDFERVAAQIEDFLWTVEFGPDGAVREVYTSPNSAGVFGAALPGGANAGAILSERLHPEDQPPFAEFSTAIRAGRTAEVEYRIRGFDGETRWIWTRAVPRPEGDRLVVDGISTNVTERRLLAERREQLLATEQQQVAKLRDLDRMKDELVAVVSHELRNPIGTIRGYTELLLDDPDLPAEHRAYAEVIDRTSAHLKQLVDQLLELARIDAGHVRLDARPLSATKLVREALGDHRPEADTKGLTLVTDLAAHLPVHGDATRLRQVLDNLLSNAVKYTPAGGTVSVSGKPVDGGVEIAVADTGIGVPADELPQLFTRFFRASTALDRGIKGTGLGLAVTKAIVEAHHGTITAETAEPHGTRFCIRLPSRPPGEPVG